MTTTEQPPSQSQLNPFGQEEMYVTKRNGKTEIISFDKILRRLRRLGTECSLKINYTTLAMKVIDQLYDKIPSTKIDELSADQCASLASTHPDYNTLAGRIVVSNHHRNTNASFSKVIRQLYEFKDSHGVNHPMISKELYQTVCSKSKDFDAICKYDRDYLIDYFGFKTLERSYLMKINRMTVERPQHMWLRVSIGIHGNDIEAVKETYEAMSQKYFTHATPTLFNAGTPRPQLSSCFLLSMESDSIDGIFNTLKDCASISKWAGGIGLHIHNVRAHGSHIRGTNGSSNGIVPMLRVFNNTAKYVDQCVTPETLVLTKDGYKLICDIRAGDVVCNRVIPESPEFGKAEFYRANDTRSPMDLENNDSISIGGALRANADEYGVVKCVLEHNVIDAELCTIRCGLNGIDSILRITPEHPVFAIRSDKWLDPRSRGEWIDAGKLESGDYLLFGTGKAVYSKVSEVTKSLYSGPLYDLEMDTDSSPNYLTKTALLHNGGGKRNGSFAIYLEPWHADVEMFLQMRKNHGDEELKARDLFYALWIPDLFMQRVKDGGKWTLMCPDECPGLSDCYGDQFVELYTKYEKEGCGKKTMMARDLWFQMLDAQMETGTPYILYKDACNLKSNQKNLGVIKSSNLCVAPETCILTNKGHVEIQSLAGQRVTVWNGYEWSDVQVEKTGVDQELIEVRTSDGCSLFCTKYHKFHVVQEQIAEYKKVHICDAKDLRVGDLLFSNRFPFVGSGYKIHEFIDFAESNGIFTDGILSIEAEYNLLKEYKFLLQNYGVNPCLTKTDDRWKLLLTNYEVVTLSRIGLSASELDEPDKNEKRHFDVIVTDIIDSGRLDDTYCFSEPLRHMGVFNGILTGQCTEIVEYSDSNETAVCNLASIGLPMFVNAETRTFDYDYLHSISKMVTRNLNKVIDINYYPTEKTRRSNFRHRPIGIGVQGLADVFIQMNMAFHSEEAKVVNRNIFETIYHAAVEQSMELAKTEGPYETFAGSPASRGTLQFDMWNVIPSDRYNWGVIRKDIQQYGMRNSLLVAPMPTASTSQILGFNECIEPLTSNIYSRRTLAGEFILANKYLMSDLIKLDLWNEKIKNNIIANNGSVQHIDVIPKEIRDKYKTVWEIPMRHLIDMAADRGAFICQSQSLNLWLEDPNYNTLTSMHFYSWNKGLKTGIYYLRRRAKHQAQQFTIEPEKRSVKEEDEHDICEYCSA